MFNPFKNSTIFMKLFLTFFLVIAPLYVITLIVNQKGSDGVLGEMAESIMARTDYFTNMLESEVARISDSLPEYVMDQDLKKLSAIGDSISEYERVELVNALQRRLYLMKYSSIYIAGAKAYVPRINRTISTTDYSQGIDMPEFEAMQRKNSGGSPLIYWNNRLFISLEYPYSMKRKPSFVLGIELSIPKMNDMLSTVIKADEGNAVIINLEQNWSVSGRADASMVAAIREFLQDRETAGQRSGLQTASLGGESWMISYKYSPALNAYLVTCLPKTYILGPITTFKIWFWVISIVSVLIIALFSYSIHNVIHRPMSKLVRIFNKMWDIHTFPTLPANRNDEFGYLYRGFNEMVERLKSLILEVYEQKIRSQRSELKRLQSQINPHFLYNCFFVLCRLIKTVDTERAYQFCLYMGNYFQYVTRDEADEIPLELEIKHALTYVHIQTVCFGDRIEVDFEQPGKLAQEGTVIRLILQPIIENAYKHVFEKTEGYGYLWIHMERNENDLYIHVEDDGDLLDDRAIELLNYKLKGASGEIENTTGIINVHRRIQLRYGEDCGISVSRSILGGLHVSIKIRPESGEKIDV
ncbi:sensor histidine kinase [Paenibacillus sp. GCM10027626]|uniref:sensor histidine kinase n=1 Tax=Paenibacillus sp. GCM10027626 TaxID=3273411 RepID=UPI00363420F8